MCVRVCVFVCGLWVLVCVIVLVWFCVSPLCLYVCICSCVACVLRDVASVFCLLRMLFV